MVIATQILELGRQKGSDAIPDVFPPLVQLGGSFDLQKVTPLPEPCKLGRLRDGRLRVVEAIEVKLMREGDKYVVESPELNEFGFGDNPFEAFEDLQEAIAELYLTLEVEQDRLGPDLSSVWTVLSQKVRKADAISRS